MADSDANYVKNVAIIGANGNAGSQIFEALLETQKFNITIITRTTTTITTPKLTLGNSLVQDDSPFRIYQGSYNDKDFLRNALKGIEVLVLALGFTAVGQYQVAIVEAAVEAGVQLILPTEYGGDNGDAGIRKITDCLQNKTPTREAIERLGGKWIGIVTGFWLEQIIRANTIGINIQKCTATLYNSGTTKFSTTNLPLLGTAISHLLSLPINPPTDGPLPPNTNPPNPPTTYLSSYTNRFLYIRSHCISQLDILKSIQRHTKTSDSDWEIKHASTEDFIVQGKDKGFGGQVRGWGEAYLGMCLLEGGGGDFEGKAVVDMEALGLEGMEGVLDEWVAEALV